MSTGRETVPMSSRPFQRFEWQRSTVTAACTSLSFPRAAPFSTTDAFSPFFRKSVIFSDSFSEQDTATGTRAATDIHVERGAGRHFSPQIWRFARNAADLSRFSAVQKDSGAFGKRVPRESAISGLSPSWRTCATRQGESHRSLRFHWIRSLGEAPESSSSPYWN